MPQFEAANFQDRQRLAEQAYRNKLQSLGDEWNASATKLRNQFFMERDPRRKHQIKMEIEAFKQSSAARRREIDREFSLEQERLRTFYQPAVEEQEPMDPVKTFRDLHTHQQRLEEQLQEFEVMPGGKHKKPVGMAFRRGEAPFVGGGLQRVVTEMRPGGKDKSLQPFRRLVPATQEDMKRWAALQADLEETKRRVGEITRSRHVKARDTGSAFDPTGGGTFVDKVEQTKPKDRPAPQPADFSQMTDEELRRIAGG